VSLFLPKKIWIYLWLNCNFGPLSIIILRFLSSYSLPPFAFLAHKPILIKSMHIWHSNITLFIMLNCSFSPLIKYHNLAILTPPKKIGSHTWHVTLSDGCNVCIDLVKIGVRCQKCKSSASNTLFSTLPNTHFFIGLNQDKSHTLEGFHLK